MKNRIKSIIDSEKMNAAQFASEIGIAPSSLHHIVSGRNNPSLDVIQKIIERYPQINVEWLVNGDGNMFKPLVQGKLFDVPVQNNKAESSEISNIYKSTPEENKNLPIISDNTKTIEKIIITYTDKTFEVYKSS